VAFVVDVIDVELEEPTDDFLLDGQKECECEY
jgi:hypothetical protein